MTAATGWPDGRTPVLLSAHADDLLPADAAAIRGYLDGRDIGPTAIAGQLIGTRRVRRHRAILRAADRIELIDGLRALAAGTGHPLLTRASETPGARLAFVFPGQGNQWPGMGADAHRLIPAYRTAADAADAAFIAAGHDSPRHYLLAADPDATFSEVQVEGAQFVHHIALAAGWLAAGVSPDVTIGHSLGEVAAAHVAGALSLPDAVAVVAARASVVDRLSGDYAVAALGLTAAEAHDLIAEIPGWLELSVINAATSIAVSGDRVAVQAAVDAVRSRGRFGRPITVNFPVHTSILEPLRDELRGQWPTGEFADTAVQFIGGATGELVAAGTPFADYWYRNLRDTVRFDCAIETAVAAGVGVFAEMSAHPALLFAIGQVLDERPAVLAGSGRSGELLTDELSANIATVAATRPDYPWADLVPATAALSGFPNAPMRPVHLWAAAPAPAPTAQELIVATEAWQPLPPVAAPTRPRRVAMLELGAPADALRSTLDRSPDVSPSDPAEADLLIVLAPTPVADDAVRAAAEVAEWAGTGLLDYPEAIGNHCRDVWLVTTCAERVAPGDVAAPAAAALAAMHRSFGFEHPDQGFHHLDLAGNTPLEAVVPVLLTGAGELALRGATTYARTLADAPPAIPWPLDHGVLDNVVISGGTGAVGRHYAEQLAARGAGRITLLSRRGTGTAELTALTARHGTEIAVVPCDVTDPAAVAAAAAGQPAATVLIHAAGTAEFASRDRLTAAATADTLAAKVLGLAHLIDHWPLQPNARILLCSSVIGVWGGAGTAAYAAANRMLDVQAAQLRAQGYRCTSMRWGLWEGRDDHTGIVDAAETARVQRSGLRPMPVAAAVDAGLCDHGDDPLVLSADTERLRLFLDSRPADALPTVDEPDDAAHAAQVVRTHLAAVLDTDPDGVDITASLFDLGVDSLLALDLRKRLKRTLGRTVGLAVLLGGITGTDLITELTSDEKMESSRD